MLFSTSVPCVDILSGCDFNILEEVNYIKIVNLPPPFFLRRLTFMSQKGKLKFNPLWNFEGGWWDFTPQTQTCPQHFGFQLGSGTGWDMASSVLIQIWQKLHMNVCPSRWQKSHNSWFHISVILDQNVPDLESRSLHRRGYRSAKYDCESSIAGTRYLWK